MEVTYMVNEIQDQIAQLHATLRRLEKEKLDILTEISLLTKQLEESAKHQPQSNYSPQQKIDIFMNLFKGRKQVFAKRWENLRTQKHGYSPACANEWVHGICNKPKIKCSDCKNQSFLPITANEIHKHLGGDEVYGAKKDYTIGLYPMLENNHCWFLAVDFDKDNWQQDVIAFIATCNKKCLPAYIEKSRSGKGAHVWFFFKDEIPAVLARKMGAILLTETMNSHPELGFESYDRFFPNQDVMPLGGFGNLIALPLQHFPRKNGNSLFVDEHFMPYEDQWSFLASVVKISLHDINQLVDATMVFGNEIGVQLPVTEDDSMPWNILPSKPDVEINIPPQLLPSTIKITLANLVFIEKANIPAILISKLLRLAAFQNPEFYKAQALRLAVYDKPRVIACAEIFSKHIGLPRGCFDECVTLLGSLGITTTVEDKRNPGKKVKVKFFGKLTTEQKKASEALLKHDTGVLSATTGFGKTVIGAYVISKRKVNTLIIVHRVQLLEQWVERLKMFLGLTSEQIGVIGGGKNKPSKIIDIAVMQSLIRKNIVNDIVVDYGQVIVDECHHLSAVSFESVAKACRAKYFLGLTATPVRKDGHQPIIFMQCGPIRYTVDAKKQAQLRSFEHKIIFKYTGFNFPSVDGVRNNINAIYAAIIMNEQRNEMIIKDVCEVLKLGRTPLILTERKEHVDYFASKLSDLCKNVIVMTGGKTTKQRLGLIEQLESIPENEERVIIATGKYIGEGFDDKRLDTLFLTMPISWHGTIAQYAGRLHREYQNKQEVVIYDYLDIQVSMLAKMAEKRKKGYLNLGYSIQGLF